MKTINKDITTIEEGVLVHQCNAQKVMGSGVALAIKNKWPQVFDSYLKYIKYFEDAIDILPIKTVSILGDIDVVEINDKLSVINLFGQEYYGGGGKRYTSYAAWEKALPRIKRYTQDRQVYFPFNCGCDRGGGDWRIISAMIEEFLPDAIFCKI